MDRGAWQATVHGVIRLGHDLATKPQPREYHLVPEHGLLNWGPVAGFSLGPCLVTTPPQFLASGLCRSASPHHPTHLSLIRFFDTSWVKPFNDLFSDALTRLPHTLHSSLKGELKTESSPWSFLTFPPEPGIYKTLNEHFLNEWNTPEMCQNLPPEQGLNSELQHWHAVSWAPGFLSYFHL